MPSDQTLTCDVAVIGAGTAGIAAARKAIEHGASTLLIDDKFAGTVCATVGCMPSKLLIAAAHAAHGVRTAPVFGVQPGDLRIDGPAVMQRVRDERDRFAAATRQSLDDLPAGTMIKARAKFVGPTRLQLDDGRTIEARRVVIATGGAPSVPKPFRDLGDLVHTHLDIFEIGDLPQSLAVLGGGAIGLELAQAFARLGVAVTLFDESREIGGVSDADGQAALQAILARELTLCLGVKVDAARQGDAAILKWSGNGSGEKAFEAVLVAAGRPPQITGLGLEATGLDLDEHGVPEFDRETMRCGDSSLFIAGDSAGALPVLHEASQDGRIAGRNAARFPDLERVTRTTAFKMTFSDPPIAIVGAPPEDGTLIGHASYEDQGRARVEARNDGLVRLYANPADGRLTGALLIAPGGDHMAHLLALAVQTGQTASQLLAMPFYHPTLEEGLKPALREICRAIPSSGDYEKSGPPGA